VTKRSRLLGYGLSCALIAAGVLGAVFVADGTGEILALVLISLGFVLATSLVFLEVGLSEDRELELERKRAQERRSPRQQLPRPRPRLPRNGPHPPHRRRP
jgi:hypothetical protein